MSAFGGKADIVIAMRLATSRFWTDLLSVSISALVKSRHVQCKEACPLYPRKQTCAALTVPPWLIARPADRRHPLCGAHRSVTTFQPYFSRSSSNNCCLLEKSRSPIIRVIDRTAAYSDRQPYLCSMTSPHIATEPITAGDMQGYMDTACSACSSSLNA